VKALGARSSLACFGLAGSLAGCTKPAPSQTTSSQTASSQNAPSEASVPQASPSGGPAEAPRPAPAAAPDSPDARAPASAAAITTGEAHRFFVARFDEDPLLRAQGALLREHFGAEAHDGARKGARGPFCVQAVDLATGAKAFLVTRADESDPIVIAVDRDRLEWQKPRPIAGMVLPSGHVTLAPRPDGGAAVFVWVEKLQTVAARMWADDGNAFGDFEVFKPDGCDSMSVAYGDGWGWIVACASPGGVRAARLREDATRAGDASGVALGSGHSTGPVAIAFDSLSSFVLVEPAAAVSADRLLAFRYDTSFVPLWPSPVDLGLASHPPGRTDANAVRTGVIRVQAVRTPNALRSPAIEITSSGEVQKPVLNRLPQ
jgi:hypothetical protein